MSKIELTLTPAGHGCKVMIDGVDISGSVNRIEVVADVDERTAVTVHYLCRTENVIALGEADVIHVCPFAEVESGESE